MHFDSVDVCKAPYIHEDGRSLSGCNAGSDVITYPVTDEIYARSFHDSINMRGSIVNGSGSSIFLSNSSLSVTVLDTSLVHLMLIQVS